MTRPRPPSGSDPRRTGPPLPPPRQARGRPARPRPRTRPMARPRPPPGGDPRQRGLLSRIRRSGHLPLAAFGDVSERRDDHPAVNAGRRREGLARDRDPPLRAVRSPHAHDHVTKRTPGLQGDDRRVLISGERRAVLPDRAPPRIERGPADHLIHGRAEDLLGCRIAGDDSPIFSLEDDPLRHALEQRPKTSLGVPHALVGRLAVRDGPPELELGGRRGGEIAEQREVLAATLAARSRWRKGADALAADLERDARIGDDAEVGNGEVLAHERLAAGVGDDQGLAGGDGVLAERVRSGVSPRVARAPRAQPGSRRPAGPRGRSRQATRARRGGDSRVVSGDQATRSSHALRPRIRSDRFGSADWDRRGGLRAGSRASRSGRRVGGRARPSGAPSSDRRPSLRRGVLGSVRPALRARRQSWRGWLGQRATGARAGVREPGRQAEEHPQPDSHQRSGREQDEALTVADSPAPRRRSAPAASTRKPRRGSRRRGRPGTAGRGDPAAFTGRGRPGRPRRSRSTRSP